MSTSFFRLLRQLARRKSWRKRSSLPLSSIFRVAENNDKRSVIHNLAGLSKWVIERSKAKHTRVLFIGYAEAALGLGVSFRSMLMALEKASMPFSIYPFSANVETRLIGSFLKHKYDITGCYEINVAYMAVDQLTVLREKLHYQIKQARYNILRTYWELPCAPREWSALLEGIDELWVPNAYVAQTFKGIYRGHITIIPVSVDVSRIKNYDRAWFNLSPGTFYFLFSFDYFSGLARKNPLAVVHAFSKAFPHRCENVGLLIKSVGPTELGLNVSRQLRCAAINDSRIRVLHGEMERDEMLSLIEQSDCYASLHRAEGFGMGMAEALAFGKPVIGTDFSGNREFLTDLTGFPVPYTLRPLLPGEYHGGDNQFWAEPNVKVAAEQMRRVFLDREESDRRCIEGKKLIASRYAGERVAQLIKARLLEIEGLIASR